MSVEQAFPSFQLKTFKTEEITSDESSSGELILVIGQQKYYGLLAVRLFRAGRTAKGGLKAPLKEVDPVHMLSQTDDPTALRFLAAVMHFQAFYEPSLKIHKSIKGIVDNPMQLPVYLHDSKISESPNPKSLKETKLMLGEFKPTVELQRTPSHWKALCRVRQGEATIGAKHLEVVHNHFVQYNGVLHWLRNPVWIQAIGYFSKYEPVQIPYDQLGAFKESVLNQIQEAVAIQFLDDQVGAPKQMTSNKRIYLSDMEETVLVKPVMLYGEDEIPLRSQINFVSFDERGFPLTLHRDYAEEDAFIGMLIRQVPEWKEQLDEPLMEFYLPKHRFTDEKWFLELVGEWTDANIEIFGFDKLKGNKINPNPAVIDIHINSGINWFNADLRVKFGKTKAKLSAIQKALKNKTKYVRLDDGTNGLIPSEWISRFEGYFRSGIIVDDLLQIPKAALSHDDEWLNTAVWDEELWNNWNGKLKALRNFDQTKWKDISGLKVNLRTYQKDGVKWLLALDELGIGGCLADDMGLGKTIQVIALLQHLKNDGRSNALVVMPTSVLMSWRDALAKFAPQLKYAVYHGADRDKQMEFRDFDLILTTYALAVSDIGILRKHTFEYVILDESQMIKNPSSQRFRAITRLESKHRLLLTGTPLENHTMDLFAQLSFACPGLLGNYRYFRDTYAVPIDQFKDGSRLEELTARVAPFILRRTKNQVLNELPDKTEVVHYCEMAEDQRELYLKFEETFRDYLMNGDPNEVEKDHMHVLRSLTVLRQLCNSSALIPGEVMTQVSSAKLKSVLEQIDEKKKNHKILVFSQFVGMLDLLSTALDSKGISYAYLTGATVNRAEEVRKFESEEETRVFLISLKAGGTGLNLTAADYVFLVDPWWNPAVEDQAIDRSYRMGQEKHVTAVRFICSDTVEEKIIGMQKDKKALANRVLSDTFDLPSNLTRHELLELLS